MSKQSDNKKSIEIMELLDRYIPDIEIPLNHQDAYTLLIAVLLSAQCTDERVNKVTPELFSLASNPQTMRKISVDKIRGIIRTCGLSGRKSQAIHDLSEILYKKYKSKVPKDMQLLEELPGVGHKTASVVMAQAFGVPSFPVDTHIHRLAFRWGLSSGKNVVTTEKDLKAFFPESKWNKIHLQMILFGRKYCKARGHDSLECPICKKFGRKDI
jgi:endonuclease-3